MSHAAASHTRNHPSPFANAEKWLLVAVAGGHLGHPGCGCAAGLDHRKLTARSLYCAGRSDQPADGPSGKR